MMSSEKIGSLHINESLIYSGGAEGYILNLASELASENIPIIISSGRNEGAVPNPNYRYLPDVHKRTDSKNFDGNLRMIEHIMAENNLKVVHLHNIKSPDLVKALSAEYATVRTIHDYRMICPTEFKLLPDGNICSRRIGQNCFDCIDLGDKPSTLSLRQEELESSKRLDLVITSSKYVKRQLANEGLENERIEVLPYFVPKTELTIPESPSKQYSSDILFVGRIAHGKGLEEALRALASMKNSANLVVCGDGSEMAECKALTNRLGMSGRVTFLGWTNRRELSKYFFNTKVVIFPSMWPEPTGLVGLEAMYYNKPIVGFDSGGVSEWLVDGKNGFLVDRGNLTLFSEKLDELLTDQGLYRHLEIGSQKILESFSIEKHIKGLMNLYAKSISHHELAKSPTNFN